MGKREQGILIGTSAFTATGWEGSFFPQGMQPRHFLSYYAAQFAAVEVDCQKAPLGTLHTVDMAGDPEG